jgi:cytoskeletal protein CcmA (bactofilin family)
MFNNKPQEVREIKEVETIIGPSVKVRGDFHGSGNIVVEGAVEGSLISDNTISIKSKAKVVANIEANDAIIGGEVEGNIKTKGYLEITGTAIINGDIEASTLSIAQGAIFNGNCIMTKKRTGEQSRPTSPQQAD